LGRPLVSLVVPALNEAESAKPLVQMFHDIKATHNDHDFELVFIDDGSTDGTIDVVLNALDENDVARVASFSRNFGSHAAISAGLALSRGDCALTLSADLQEPLEVVGRFLAMWRDGYDIIWGLRSTRSMRKGPSYGLALFFSRMLSRHSEIPTYPAEGPSQILVSRAVIDTVNAMPERNRNVLGMVAWAGFRQGTLFFEQLPLHASSSKWTLKKKFRLVVDSFAEFSNAPVKLASLLGVVLAIAGAVALGVALVDATGSDNPAVGWPTVAALVLLIGGVQLIFMGVLGEYLWRVGYDAKDRPLYILRGVIDVGPEQHDV
jgi:polyisoprenyl-phosphate glycosyltransferase